MSGRVGNNLLGLLSGLALVNCTFSAYAQRPSPQAPGSVSSTGQSGGVTAWYIGEVHYNDEPRTDPQTQQLASALNTFRTDFMANVRQPAGGAGYVYLADIPRFGPQPRDTSALYMIFASDDPDEDSEAVCRVNERVSLHGLAGYFPSNLEAWQRGGTATIPMRLLTRADRPLLQRLCDSLGRPVSWLRGRSSSQSSNSQATVYDFVTRDTGILVLMLMPGRMQGQNMSTGFGRYFWAGALVGRYNRVPSNQELMTDPANYEQASAMQNGQLGNFAIALPAGMVRPGSTGVEAYPPDARREFGDRLAHLDTEWERYIAGASVTIRGRERPLMNGNSPADMLPVFSLEEIGTPAFWLASTDFARMSEMVGCIGGRFLSERYRVDTSGTDMGRCATSEIRMGSR